jgi:alpha,alpha-trehalase
MKIIKTLIISLLALGACQTTSQKTEEKTTQLAPLKPISPDKLYGDLFVQVQMQKTFPDGKTFVDCTPKIEPAEIVKKYAAEHTQANFDLKKFVLTYRPI